MLRQEKAVVFRDSDPAPRSVSDTNSREWIRSKLAIQLASVGAIVPLAQVLRGSMTQPKAERETQCL